MITGLAGKFFLTSIGKKLPPWLWEIIAIALLAAGAALWHHGIVVSHDNGIRATQKSADDKVYAARATAIAAQAAALRRRTERLEATINTKWSTIHDQEISDHAAAASALLLRGPGAAAAVGCRPVGHPAVAAAADRHDQGASTGEAPGPQLYPADGSALQPADAAIVSWKWLVTVVQEHDDLLTDVKTIEADHTEQNQAWEQMRATKLKPVKP